MDEVRFDRWLLQVDRAATAEAYRQLSPASETCGCSACRNFAAAGERAYPSEFRELCSRLGVPVNKEREVYAAGRTEDGKHAYGGWFQFVGRVESRPVDEDYQYSVAGSGFSVYFAERPALVPEALRDRPVVQVEFTVAVPWVLDEPAPD